MSAKPMPPNTLNALKASIAKWEKVAAGNEIGMCPLCKLFNSYKGQVATDCIGCPVFNHTGKLYCEDTPQRLYQYAEDAEDWQVLRPYLKSLARAEVEFLKSLLPEDES